MPSRNFSFILIAILVCYACYNAAVKNRFARLFSEAVTIVEEEALHDVPSESLFKSAMEGMLKGFDRHSAFISGDSFKSLNEDLEGAFGGVGIHFEPVDGEGVLVLAVVPGNPAAAAGMIAGDVITAIDDNSTVDLEPSAIRGLMTGAVGVELKVSYTRNGEAMETRVQRASVAIKSVQGIRRNIDGSWDHALPQHPELTYIRLTRFDKGSATEVADVLKALPDGTTGVILDVRGNGGGLLTAAESICDTFLEPGLSIVKIKGRKGIEVRHVVSTGDPLIDPSIKVAVLTNRNSASASEVVAACLQDHGRGIVIGEQSWGKGTVQNIIPMQLGSSALKLTTFSYWPPSDRPIDRYHKDVVDSKQWGVLPNEGMSVVQEAVDVACLIKKMHVREISGLIPENKREAIVDTTVNNFLEMINRADTRAAMAQEETVLGDAAEPLIVFDENAVDEDVTNESKTEARGDDQSKVSPPSDGESSDGESSDGESSDGQRSLDSRPEPLRRVINRGDIESDAVLEKAIKALLSPEFATQKAA